MSYRDLKKTFRIEAEPEDIYASLTNPFTIELWSGEPAEMSTVPGTEFSIFGGDICGMNRAFVENELVEQEWYFGEQDVPSIVTIRLSKTPEQAKTQIDLIHTNIPADDFADIAHGWEHYFFGTIKQFYEKA